LQGEIDFKLGSFLVMIDMPILSLKGRFQELQIFKSILGVLLSSTILKELDDSELEDYCNRYAKLTLKIAVELNYI
jgi:hypothetical protein